MPIPAVIKEAGQRVWPGETRMPIQAGIGGVADAMLFQLQLRREAIMRGAHEFGERLSSAAAESAERTIQAKAEAQRISERMGDLQKEWKTIDDARRTAYDADMKMLQTVMAEEAQRERERRAVIGPGSGRYLARGPGKVSDVPGWHWTGGEFQRRRAEEFGKAKRQIEKKYVIQPEEAATRQAQVSDLNKELDIVIKKLATASGIQAGLEWEARSADTKLKLELGELQRAEKSYEQQRSYEAQQRSYAALRDVQRGLQEIFTAERAGKTVDPNIKRQLQLQEQSRLEELGLPQAAATTPYPLTPAERVQIGNRLKAVQCMREKVEGMKRAGMPIEPGVEETLRVTEQEILHELGWPQAAAWKAEREPRESALRERLRMLEEAGENIDRLDAQVGQLSKCLGQVCLPVRKAEARVILGQVVRDLTTETDKPALGRFTPAAAETLSKLPDAEARRVVIKHLRNEIARLKKLRAQEQIKFEELRRKQPKEEAAELRDIRNTLPE
jgi:hypothetical protein